MSETHWKKLTNPNYLGSWDFAKGEERTLTIQRVLQEEVFNPTDNSKKYCIVAYFTENVKPMVLNKTNCKMIASLYNTPIIEKWSGHRVIVVVEKVKAFGKLEEGLRIKKQIPKQETPKREPEKPQLLCSLCSSEVEAFGKYSAEEVANKNLKRFGKQLCADCSGRLKNGGETNETNP